jgi:hypothetical protein
MRLSLGYRRRVWVGLLMVLVALLSACDRLTGSSQVGDLETQVFQLEATIDGMGDPATIQALQQAATQNVNLQAQLDVVRAEGTATMQMLNGDAIAALPPAAPDVPGAAAAQTPTPAGESMASDAGDPSDQAAAAAAEGSSPNGAPPTRSVPPATSATPPASVQTSFSNTVMSTGVQESDSCSLDRMTVFDTDEDQLFVVTTIRSLKAGSVLEARWTANGAQVYTEAECWKPDADWDEVCAYCEMVPADGSIESFQVGTWAVELWLDGQLRSQARFEL